MGLSRLVGLPGPPDNGHPTGPRTPWTGTHALSRFMASRAGNRKNRDLFTGPGPFSPSIHPNARTHPGCYTINPTC